MFTRVSCVYLPSARVAAARFASTAASRQVTKLENGIRVITDNEASHAATVAVAVGGGASAQTFANNGIAHFVARSSFQGGGTRSLLRMIRDIEDSGASVSSSANREEILYTADVLAPQLPKVVGILADAITAPRVVDYQLDEVRTGVREDSETQLSDGIIATVDALHTAAYREAGLGLSPFASSSAAQSLGVDEVKAFRQALFTGPNTVIAASGVNHDSFVQLARQAFAKLPNTPASRPAASKFVGGEIRVPNSGDVSSFGVALNGATFGDDKVFAYAVLQTILGQKRSGRVLQPVELRSTQGRLLQAVKDNQSIYEIEAFNANYVAGGLFGIAAVGASSSAGELANLVINSLKGVSKVDAEAVKRAKTTLRAQVLFTLENRTNATEDIARQVLHADKALSAAEIVERINAVSEADVANVGKALLQQSTVAVAGIGNIAVFPSARDIEAALRK